MWFSPAMFNYMAAGVETEDYLPKIEVSPGQLERNGTVEVEGICKGVVLIIDTGP